ncbi:MAG: VWA domain-containing protein [Terriglobales bacterium]
MYHRLPAVLLLTLTLTFSAAAQETAGATQLLTAKRLDAPPPLSTAQALGTQPAPVLMTLHKDVHEVRLLFTVTDRQNRPVRDLKPEQVVVLDRAEPVQITSFQRDSDLPLRLGLLIDSSASVDRLFPAEQRAAREFLGRVLRPDQDRALVMTFTAHARMQQEETGDLQKLTLAIDATMPEVGMTALYDAIYEVCTKRLLPNEAQMRRAIVLLSDGEDNFSLRSVIEAAEAAQRAEIALYAISIHKGQRTDGDIILEQLAGATGGLAFVISKPEQYNQAFTAIEEQLRSQYAVTYKVPGVQRNGAFYRVRVHITDAGEFKVHARAGYWAPRR